MFVLPLQPTFFIIQETVCQILTEDTFYSAVVYQISDQLVYWPNFPPDSRVLVQQPSSIGQLWCIKSVTNWFIGPTFLRTLVSWCNNPLVLVYLQRTSIYMLGMAPSYTQCLLSKMKQLYSLHQHLFISMAMQGIWDTGMECIMLYFSMHCLSIILIRI